MQKILRALILIAMAITAYLLVLAWRDDYTNQPIQNTQANQTVETSSSSDLPSANNTSDIPASSSDLPSAGKTSNMAPTATKLINVSTDMYDIKIDPVGGDVVYAALKSYNASLDSEELFVLLEENANRVYIAQSGLVGQDGIDTEKGRAQYQYENNSYSMGDSETLDVPLTYNQNGITVTKTFIFSKGTYPITVNYKINNATTNPWQGQMFAQLKRDGSKDPGMENKGPLSMATFLGGAWGTPDSDYNTLDFDDFNDSELKPITSKDGWVAIIQHYFVSAWTPSGDFEGHFFSSSNKGANLIGFLSPTLEVAPGTEKVLSATLYAGPKVQNELKDVAVGLNKTVDYGIFWPISKVMFAVLQQLHNVFGNWGWSIIGLTLLVKIALMWISGKSYYSMAKMRAIAPKLQALKEESGDDKMAMSQAMMKIYKEEKVNPMAGCLPMLMQMPIFLGLYWVLVESIELRHAPWILWIQDLSAMDQWFILPAIMGASMFLQQMLNPQPTDPTQAKVMKIMPIVFTAMMMFFPAGLVLYWTVNNIFSMSQQYYINKKVEKEYQARTENTVTES